MCEEGKALITGYLDALEECDRRHLMFLGAFRRDDPEGIEGYRGLVREAKSKLQAARGRFQDHQTVHNCCEIIQFEDDLSSGAITARDILPEKSRSSSTS
jgi:hypothetical protein